MTLRQQTRTLVAHISVERGLLTSLTSEVATDAVALLMVQGMRIVRVQVICVARLHLLIRSFGQYASSYPMVKEAVLSGETVISAKCQMPDDSKKKQL